MKTIEELTAAKTAWYASDNQEVWTHGPYETRAVAALLAETDDETLGNWF